MFNTVDQNATTAVGAHTGASIDAIRVSANEVSSSLQFKVEYFEDDGTEITSLEYVI